MSKDGRALFEELLEYLTEGCCEECKSSKLEMVERQVENRFAAYSNKRIPPTRRKQKSRRAGPCDRCSKGV